MRVALSGSFSKVGCRPIKKWNLLRDKTVDQFVILITFWAALDTKIYMGIIEPDRTVFTDPDKGFAKGHQNSVFIGTNGQLVGCQIMTMEMYCSMKLML